MTAFRIAPFLLAVAAAILLASCGDGETTAPRTPGTTLTAAGGSSSPGRYPLEPGWEWTYVRTFTLLDPATGEVDYASVDSCWVTAAGEVDLVVLTAHAVETHAVEYSPNQEPRTFDSSVYYTQDRDRLVEVAYAGTGPAVGPAPEEGEAGRAYRVGGRTYPSLPALARALRSDPVGGFFTRRGGTALPPRPGSGAPPSNVIFREDPRVVLVYPLRPGQDWVSFSDPFLQTREVVGRGAVHVPAGHLGAAEILSSSPGLGFEYTDWVGPAGLVLRDFRGEVEVTGPGGEVVGVLVFVDRTELIEARSPAGNRATP